MTKKLDKTEKKMRYKTRVVAFIDILGFKESIKKSNKDKKEYERVLNTLTELQDFFIKPRDEYLIEADEALKLDTQIMQVSDSLVISRLLEGRGGIYKMLTHCAFATHLLISNGYLCRGAIKIGNLHHTDKMIFGEAFIKAYSAESEERYPIIKFDKELFEIARTYPALANEANANWEVDFIKKDCQELMTGIYYLNYFTNYDNLVGGGEGAASIHYSDLRDIIVNGLKEKAPSVYEKYRWAADQFNKTAKNYELEIIE
jgi:hypothetical protein